MIHTGDCIEVMRGMPADSVDAVVTDPPYGLGFMGKAWDTAGQRASIPPSVAVRIEDGRDVGRLGNYPGGKGPGATAFDGQAFQAWCQQWGHEALRVTKPGGYLLAFGGTRTHHRLVCGLEDAGWIIRDELDWIYASGFPKGEANLKPAHEPIVLARKPGPLLPLGIDECRIGTTDEERAVIDNRSGGQRAETEWQGPGVARQIGERFTSSPSGRWPSNLLLSDPELFDEPNPWVVGSGATSDSGEPHQVRRRATSLYEGGWASTDDGMAPGGSGGYSRYFLVPKSSRADREPVVRGQLDSDGDLPFDDFNRNIGNTLGKRRENAHPTVKPTDLMRHLVRLVTPSGGTVLDPFLGSGSTAIACELEGFPWIGIEKEPEYVAIAEARLNGTQRGLGLDVGAPVRRSGGPTGMEKGHHPDSYQRHSDKGWSGGWADTPDEEPAA